MKYKMMVEKIYTLRNVSYLYTLCQEKKILCFNYWSQVYTCYHNNKYKTIEELIQQHDTLCKIKADEKEDDSKFPIEIIKECE